MDETTLSFRAIKIEGVPAILFGEPSEYLYVFLPGQYGTKEEAQAFAKLACPAGWKVMGIDLPGHGECSDKESWVAVPEIRKVVRGLRSRYQHIALRANSIGAWFGVLALAQEPLEQALFVSSVLDMERLIYNRMGWTGVTQERLQREQEIPTSGGRPYPGTISHGRETIPLPAGWHRLKSCVPVQMLRPNRFVAEAFAARFECDLTLMEEGDRWFHTPGQLAVMWQWTKQCLLSVKK